MQSQWERLRQGDAALTEGMARMAIPLLRVSLAITYIWFGALKLAGRSPVADLVNQTAPALPKRWLVRTLGVWEVAIGVALLLRVALRPTLLLFFLQLGGTFLTFLMQPGRMFQHGNPLLLTKDGEFVLKNLVLLAAGLAVGSTVRREDEKVPTED
ncbi:MAG TPA: hypothetical protein VFS21_33185 [Roseiflexaceae bacterium]|nr:hypothetical protein [Roseiflexaceae bacterium]